MGRQDAALVRKFLEPDNPMPVGSIELDGARATIAHCAVVPVKLRDRCREIVDMFVAPDFRWQGRGSALLRAICDQADAGAVLLVLTVRDERDPVKHDALILWYSGHGFVTLQDDGKLAVLVREPIRASSLHKQPLAALLERLH